MSGRPAVIRQRDAKQLLKAARQAGAKRVEFHIRGEPVIVHLGESEDKSEAEANEWLDDDAHSA